MRNILLRLWRAAILPLCTLNAIQFSAPWKHGRSRCG
jgi:hypothetical protein